jgi:hypothetical protein
VLPDEGLGTNLFCAQRNAFLSGFFISVGTIELSDVEESVAWGNDPGKQTENVEKGANTDL